MQFPLFKHLFILTIVTPILTGCGHHNDSSISSNAQSEQEETNDNSNIQTTFAPMITVKGSAMKGIMTNARITLFPIIDGAVSPSPLSSTTSSATDGSFTISVESNYQGPAAIVVTSNTAKGDGKQTQMVCDILPDCGKGINFGEHVPLPNDFQLRALVPAIRPETITTVTVTALTELASAYAVSNTSMTDLDIVTANSMVADMFRINGPLTTFNAMDITNGDTMKEETSDSIRNAIISAAILSANDGDGTDIFGNFTRAVNEFSKNHGTLVNISSDATEFSFKSVIENAVAIATRIETHTDLGAILSELAAMRGAIQFDDEFIVGTPSPTIPPSTNASTAIVAINPESGPPSTIDDSITNNNSEISTQPLPATPSSVAKVKAMVNDIRTLGVASSYDDLRTGATDFKEQLNTASEFIKRDTKDAITVLEGLESALRTAWSSRETLQLPQTISVQNDTLGLVKIEVTKTLGSYKFAINEKLLSFDVDLMITALKDEMNPSMAYRGTLENNNLSMVLYDGESSLSKIDNTVDGHFNFGIRIASKTSNPDDRVAFEGQFNASFTGVSYQKTKDLINLDNCENFSYCQWYNYTYPCNIYEIDCLDKSDTTYYGSFKTALFDATGQFSTGGGESFEASFAVNLRNNNVVFGSIPLGYERTSLASYQITEGKAIVTYPMGYKQIVRHFSDIDSLVAAGYDLSESTSALFGANGPFITIENYLNDAILPQEYPNFHPTADIIPVNLYNSYFGANISATNLEEAIHALLTTSIYGIQGNDLGFSIKSEGFYELTLLKDTSIGNSGVLSGVLTNKTSNFQELSAFGFGEKFVDFSFTLELNANFRTLANKTTVIISGERKDLETLSASVEVDYDGHRVKVATGDVSVQNPTLENAKILTLSNQDGVTGNLYDGENGIAGSLSLDGKVYATVETNERGMVLIYYSDNSFESLK